LIYVENRRLITRAPDQIEDIKLVVEFWFILIFIFLKFVKMDSNATEDKS
jgi:hypothetical protein